MIGYTPIIKYRKHILKHYIDTTTLSQMCSDRFSHVAPIDVPDSVDGEREKATRAEPGQILFLCVLGWFISVFDNTQISFPLEHIHSSENEYVVEMYIA